MKKLQTKLQQNKRFFGLRTKLLVHILGIVLLTLTVSTLAVMHTADKTLISSGKEKILNSALVVGNSVTAQINRAKMDMTFAHRVPDIAATLDPTYAYGSAERARFIDRANGLLASLGDVGGYYETFYTVSSSGMTLACSMPSAVGTLDISNRAWFHEAMKTGELTLSGPFRSRITGDALMTIAQRFDYKEHSGLMVGSLQLYNFMLDALQQENHPWQQALVVTSSGLVAASVNDGDIGVLSFLDRKWFTTMIAKKLNYFEISENGVEKVASLLALDGTDLYVLVLTDRSHLTAPVEEVKRISIVAIGGAVLLSFLGIFIVVTPAT